MQDYDKMLSISGALINYDITLHHPLLPLDQPLNLNDVFLYELTEGLVADDVVGSL